MQVGAADGAQQALPQKVPDLVGAWELAAAAQFAADGDSSGWADPPKPLTAEQRYVQVSPAGLIVWAGLALLVLLPVLQLQCHHLASAAHNCVCMCRPTLEWQWWRICATCSVFPSCRACARPATLQARHASAALAAALASGSTCIAADILVLCSHPWAEAPSPTLEPHRQLQDQLGSSQAGILPPGSRARRCRRLCRLPGVLKLLWCKVGAC